MSTVLAVPRAQFGIPPWEVMRFTVSQYEQMVAAGVLDEDDAVELLQGWIVEKMPKDPPHDGTIDLIDMLLSRHVPAGWYVRVQNSLVTPDSVPEPDLLITRGKPTDFLVRHPNAGDAAAVIEVADSSVVKDRLKAQIYAAAEIPQYWLVNLPARQLETFAQPIAAASDYLQKRILRLGEVADLTIASTVIQIPVSDIFPEVDG